MTPRSTRALAGALAALALLAPHTADAQRLVAMNAPEGEVASQETGWSLASALASPVLEVRRGALEGTMARLRGEARSLHTAAVVPALLSVYASDPDVQCRLGAVVALHAIGDDVAMAELRRLVRDQPTRRVQVATLGALVDHYGLDALPGAADLAEVAEGLLESSRAER